jgi:hypothetical protein
MGFINLTIAQFKMLAAKKFRMNAAMQLENLVVKS